MTVRYSYVPAKRDNVNAALSALFGALENGDARFNRSAGSNLIIPLSRPELLEAVEEDIDVLSMAHPSRVFVLYFDDSLEEVQASVSARCQALSKNEHVCSEVIRVGLPRSHISAAPSVIRANLLTGIPSEFYLYDAAFDVDALRQLSTLGDTIILDSGDFEGRFDAFEQICSLAHSVLDLQWVALGIWRDEIKDLFGRPIVRDYAGNIRSVSITAQTSTGAADGASSLLLASWIAGRLGLGNQLLFGHDGFEFNTPSGQSVRISLHAVSERGPSCIREVLFRFEPLRIGTEPQEQYIRLTRAEQLESAVELRVSFRSTRPFDDESREGRIRRYFLIGESMANYTAAARLALDLARLRRGFYEK